MRPTDGQIKMLLTIEPKMAIELDKQEGGNQVRLQMAEVGHYLVKYMDIILPINVLRFLYHRVWVKVKS